MSTVKGHAVLTDAGAKVFCTEIYWSIVVMSFGRWESFGGF